MKILIATDGSEHSQAAIAESCALFIKPENTQIKIVSVYEQMTPIAAEPFGVSAEYYQEMLNAARLQSENFAAAAAAQIKDCFPGSELDVSTRVEIGAPARVIVEIAHEWKPDLIVVGSHGRGFWGRLTIGSVSDAIVHHAPCSVFIARRT